MRRWRIWLCLLIWTLAILIQWPLWFGKGGWLRVVELRQRLVEVQAEIEHEKTENEALVAEVRSLHEGTSAIEERARRELYMVKQGEVLFRVQRSPEEQAKIAAEEASRAAEAMRAESNALARAKKENPVETDDAPAVDEAAMAKDEQPAKTSKKSARKAK
ncbi:MAG: septum formation initiator family protein [Sutterellaceae bacterium]|nr:septum formation initiator family protein [Sutterellaceae bacterium]MDD7442728.1 septum formation initiator family protein [Sutterellaceae bacterium]MDY2867312.1 septum formation initiator family protein [Mesosutterella sp.]